MGNLVFDRETFSDFVKSYANVFVQVINLVEIEGVKMRVLSSSGADARKPGVGVMIKNFGDFCQFSAKKIGVFLKNKCYDHFFPKTSST
jgi:hypothetical protein